ncbi:hypothetical protein MKX78_10875 [Cytobacillus sp. FSL R5-0569]|uniref:hypothetical protein n=1 Tax=Cytobacillus sp. FSL R5-0569 TaxID=2921649 RepID=UPI0030F53305
MIDFSKYHITKTEDFVKLVSIEPNKDGFIIEATFTRDEEEHKEAVEAIREFFIREIF